MTLLEEVRTTKNLPKPARARAVRAAAGVSQARMADELGVHRVTLARWESGKWTPRGDSRVAYAQLIEALRLEIGR
jgi:transcriptional regulator with XRE-family HTH domain